VSTKVIQIRNRDRIERRGVYITLVNKHRRMVYQQLNGEIELADLCTCSFDWQPDFEVTRSPDCVIDQHRLEAIKEWKETG
jgi:hypothetical protein